MQTAVGRMRTWASMQPWSLLLRGEKRMILTSQLHHGITTVVMIASKNEIKVHSLLNDLRSDHPVFRS
jgi:hypothetical protein